MESVEHQRSTALSIALVLVGALCLMGVVYCALAAVGLQSHPALPTWQFLFYGAWLASGALCVYALLRWKRWGVVGLGVAALVVSLVSLIQGSVTLQGVSLRSGPDRRAGCGTPSCVAPFRLSVVGSCGRLTARPMHRVAPYTYPHLHLAR